VASNDGYLLQYFQRRGIQVFGVEPASNVAVAAVAKGIPTAARFFGAQTARDLVSQGLRPRLIAANNVVALREPRAPGPATARLRGQPHRD
jgi:hypothetical protein